MDDRIVRVLGPDEAKNMHKLHTTPTSAGSKYGNYVYFMCHDFDSDDVYHYILVDNVSYRITYQDLGDNRLKFTGTVVEIEDNDVEFIDDEDY